MISAVSQSNSGTTASGLNVFGITTSAGVIDSYTSVTLRGNLNDLDGDIKVDIYIYEGDDSVYFAPQPDIIKVSSGILERVRSFLGVSAEESDSGAIAVRLIVLSAVLLMASVTITFILVRRTVRKCAKQFSAAVKAAETRRLKHDLLPHPTASERSRYYIGANRGAYSIHQGSALLYANVSRGNKFLNTTQKNMQSAATAFIGSIVK